MRTKIDDLETLRDNLEEGIIDLSNTIEHIQELEEELNTLRDRCTEYEVYQDLMLEAFESAVKYMVPDKYSVTGACGFKEEKEAFLIKKDRIDNFKFNTL